MAWCLLTNLYLPQNDTSSYDVVGNKNAKEVGTGVQKKSYTARNGEKNTFYDSHVVRRRFSIEFTSLLRNRVDGWSLGIGDIIYDKYAFCRNDSVELGRTFIWLLPDFAILLYQVARRSGHSEKQEYPRLRASSTRSFVALASLRSTASCPLFTDGTTVGIELACLWRAFWPWYIER
jgi:hypothetical protein